LDVIDAQVPAELDVHIILDNYGTHKTALIRKWFAKRPRFHLHFTPTYGSWINLLVCRTHQQAHPPGRVPQRPGVRSSHPRVYRRAQRRPKPFVWTRTADQILDSITRYAQRTLATQPS
jgi:hypothetical protein